jgi:hypothetical protein
MHRHDSVARFANHRIAPPCHPKDLMADGPVVPEETGDLAQDRGRSAGEGSSLADS